MAAVGAVEHVGRRFRKVTSVTRVRAAFCTAAVLLLALGHLVFFGPHTWPWGTASTVDKRIRHGAQVGFQSITVLDSIVPTGSTAYVAGWKTWHEETGELAELVEVVAAGQFRISRFSAEGKLVRQYFETSGGNIAESTSSPPWLWPVEEPSQPTAPWLRSGQSPDEWWRSP